MVRAGHSHLLHEETTVGLLSLYLLFQLRVRICLNGFQECAHVYEYEYSTLGVKVIEKSGMG